MPYADTIIYAPMHIFSIMKRIDQVRNMDRKLNYI